MVIFSLLLLAIVIKATFCSSLPKFRSYHKSSDYRFSNKISQPCGVPKEILEHVSTDEIVTAIDIVQEELLLLVPTMVRLFK